MACDALRSGLTQDCLPGVPHHVVRLIVDAKNYARVVTEAQSELEPEVLKLLRCSGTRIARVADNLQNQSVLRHSETKDPAHTASVRLLRRITVNGARVRTSTVPRRRPYL